MNTALGALDVGPEALFSTLGRIAARGLETAVLAEKVTDWVDELTANLGNGDLRVTGQASNEGRRLHLHNAKFLCVFAGWEM